MQSKQEKGMKKTISSRDNDVHTTEFFAFQKYPSWLAEQYRNLLSAGLILHLKNGHLRMITYYFLYIFTCRRNNNNPRENLGELHVSINAVLVSRKRDFKVIFWLLVMHGG